MMAQEHLDDWYNYAKELAKAERELKVDHWVLISFETRNSDGTTECLHKIDLPRHMLDRWLWLIEWRRAKLICRFPRKHIMTYYSYYDKHSGLEAGINMLLNKVIAAKAQITRTKKIIDLYINDMTQNNMFFCLATDERLLKAKAKLEQKQQKYNALYLLLQDASEKQRIMQLQDSTTDNKKCAD